MQKYNFEWLAMLLPEVLFRLLPLLVCIRRNYIPIRAMLVSSYAGAEEVLFLLFLIIASSRNYIPIRAMLVAG